MRQSNRSFVERIDFRTSPGNLGGAEQQRADPARAGLAGARPERRRDRPRASTTSTTTARCGSTRSTRGRRVEQARETIGWDVKVAADVATTPAPSDDELRLIREELDPGGAYTK